VHRDIKPANVMLTRDGSVKVMDFGIARAASDASTALTQTAAVVGTAAYLSPEQARGEHVDTRSDLYSTGCLLYELLTGGPPFTGDSAVAVAYQHVREDPAPPSDHDASLPPTLDAVVLKAMAKNPANRYQSAQEMRADLLRARAGDPVLATPILESMSPLAPAAVTLRHTESRRGRGLAYTLFALLLVGLVVGVALLVRSLVGGEAALVPAPTVVGLDQRQAVVVLAAQGLSPGRIDEEFVPDGPQAPAFGTVLRQSPDPDILVPNGGSVDLVVSKGVEMTLVPTEVIGQSREEAGLLLAERKLEVKGEVSRDGNVPAGTVLAISPPPGTQLSAGSAVTLTVASGQVQVPDVRGQSREDAVSALRQAGFSVGIESRVSRDDPDLVLEQEPVNQLAGRGTAVIVVVSVRPPPPSPEPSPPPSPSPGPEPSPSPSPPTSAEPSPAPPSPPPPPPPPPPEPTPSA